MVTGLPAIRRTSRRPVQSGASGSSVSAFSSLSCQNRIRPALPWACSTRELNCWYVSLASSLLNSWAISGWLMPLKIPARTWSNGRSLAKTCRRMTTPSTCPEDGTMKTEQGIDVVMLRHVFASDRPFDQVLAGIFSGISQPDIAQLFSKLEASDTYQQFSSLVEQAQGSAGLMRFWQLNEENALTLDPEAPDWTGRRLVRLIAGNPVTMGQMTRHVADAGSYAPVTILIEETPDDGTRVAYDSVVSALAPYDNAAASTVAEQLDAEVLGLLREATAVPAR